MTNKQTSITDVKESILEAQAEMMEIVREVMAEIVMPQVKMELNLLLIQVQQLPAVKAVRLE